MKRSGMVCRACIKYHSLNAECRLNPVPVPVEDPDNHWCSRGVWHFWSERYKDLEPIHWGEWEVEK